MSFIYECLKELRPHVSTRGTNFSIRNLWLNVAFPRASIGMLNCRNGLEFLSEMEDGFAVATILIARR